jgi:tetratricopeptide (TPR) repeat protein
MNAPYLDLPITSDSSEAKAAIIGFADELMSHGSNARIIFEALNDDPDCAVAHACAAALFLTQMTRAGQAQAAPHIAAAKVGTRFATERERYFIAAVAYWGKGENAHAVRILRAIVETWPHDLVAAKLCQILELGLGDLQGMRRTSAMAAAVEGRSGYALGLHAYALEQIGEPALALRFALRAMEVNPTRDPWAQHSAAHALVAMGQSSAARSFLRAHVEEWDRCSSFMLTHNWWHLALCDLELGNPTGALEMFDERVWGVRKGHAQDQINAISLLARLEMQGVEAKWRWADIARHFEGREGDSINGFLDLHYLYALARSGRDGAANRMVDNMQCQGVISALAVGIVAYTRSEYRKAAEIIAPVVWHLGEIGGSNIQRDLFAQIYMDSAKRARTQEGFRVAA